jgi:hypothetical protein
MVRIIPVLFLLVISKALFAQHIHYSDKAKTQIHTKPATPAAEIVYHDWPDRCPAVSGSIPVLTNYVPNELKLKLTEIYKGHLYSITSLKLDNGNPGYKLKVCVKGEIKFEYADEGGNIITR